MRLCIDNYYLNLSKHLAMADKKNLRPKFAVYAPDDLEKNWFVYFYQDGRRVRKYGNINQFQTAAERMAEAQRLIDDLSANTPDVSDLKTRLYSALESKKAHWRNKTYQTIKTKLDKLFAWLDRRPLNADTLRAFFDHISVSRHSTTFNSYHQKLKQLLALTGDVALIDGISSVREHRTPARFFQRYQIEQLKAVMSDEAPDLWLFVQFLFYCFIRPGELRWLRAGDILFYERRILIRGEISKNHKTEYVAIPAAFMASLEAIKTRPASALVFPGISDPGKPIGMNTMSTRHRAILRRLGFSKEYQLYSWKHTGAVMAVKAGIGLKELQLQLRHHSLDQVNEYLRQMGVSDMSNLQNRFPEI